MRKLANRIDLWIIIAVLAAAGIFFVLWNMNPGAQRAEAVIACDGETVMTLTLYEGQEERDFLVLMRDDGSTDGTLELLRRAARAEASPDETMQQKYRDLQRMLDRQQVDHDLHRIAWEKDFDDCAGHLRAVMDSLRAYVAKDAESDTLSGAVVALQEAEGFLERQRMMVQ